MLRVAWGTCILDYFGGHSVSGGKLMLLLLLLFLFRLFMTSMLLLTLMGWLPCDTTTISRQFKSSQEGMCVHVVVAVTGYCSVNEEHNGCMELWTAVFCPAAYIVAEWEFL